MNKPKIKAAFFDIDGTSYVHAIHDVLPSTIEAITNLRKQGIKTAICTSRSYNELKCLPTKYLDLMDIIISDAGAVISEKGKVIYHTKLDQNDVAKAIAFLDEHHLVYRWNYMNVHNYLSVSDKEIQDRFFRLYQMHPDTQKYQGEDLTHILYYVQDESVASELSQMLEQSFHLRLGYANEITALNVNKGYGIKKCCDLWGISVDEVAAFGDGVNDVPMFEVVKTGIALGNACKELKAVATYVSPNIEDDGLYKACEYFEWLSK